MARVLEPLGRRLGRRSCRRCRSPTRSSASRASASSRRSTASSLVSVQTPQAFLAEALRAAYAGEHGEATDCAALVEARGGRVCWVEGDPRLRKVTTPEDLALVEAG